MNIFTIEIFIFANFVQKIEFKQCQFQKMSVKIAEFSLFGLRSLRLLGENCLKAPKVPLNKYFYHWNVHFC